MAGYSGTPLAKKLGIRERDKMHVLGAPKSYRALLSAQRNTFKKWLLANAPKARVTGSWDISLNAVSVKLNGTW